MELPAFCSGCSASHSTLREPVPRLQSAPRPGPLQPRSGSFLIRDILADCLPLSDPGPVLCDPGEFQDKSLSSSSSDIESRVQCGPPDAGMERLKKPRKARTAFSDQQLSRLERSFQKQKYLSVQDRMTLAAALQLSDAQVKTWYQNRRTKWKRQSVGLELLAGAGRMYLPPHFLFPPAPPTLDLYLYRGHAPLHHQAPPLLN
ncbi:hypothetical protein PBY51_004630 [Eleginops maclovinus]|uniref:Homeobox domain-containing protein n=1 Tax=Eleginops maclovinus TaxID=56733 RepID=A0AAN8AWF8_ELEMC|nr:hypothetical protein PBY51_004630 [Eleginops maclovinus]